MAIHYSVSAADDGAKKKGTRISYRTEFLHKSLIPMYEWTCHKLPYHHLLYLHLSLYQVYDGSCHYTQMSFWLL